MGFGLIVDANKIDNDSKGCQPLSEFPFHAKYSKIVQHEEQLRVAYLEQTSWSITKNVCSEISLVYSQRYFILTPKGVHPCLPG
jgi:hypothetical protein